MKILKSVLVILSILAVFTSQVAYGGWTNILIQVRDNSTGAAKYVWSRTGQTLNVVKTATAEDWEKTEPERKVIIADVSSFGATAWDRSCGVSKEAWEATSAWCSKNKVVIANPAAFASKEWDKTSGVSKEAWEATQKWSSEHKDQIVNVVVVAGTIAVMNLSQSSDESIDRSSSETVNQSSDASVDQSLNKAENQSSSETVDQSSSKPGDYSTIEDSPAVGPGKPFTPAQKEAILEENMNRNGGVLRSDQSGQILYMPEQYTKGYNPPPNEAQVDHIVPRSQGGDNSSANAQVLSRQENQIKSDN